MYVQNLNERNKKEWLLIKLLKTKRPFLNVVREL